MPSAQDFKVVFYKLFAFVEYSLAIACVGLAFDGEYIKALGAFGLYMVVSVTEMVGFKVNVKLRGEKE